MKTSKKPCGCHVEDIGHMPARIQFCPMHEASPILLRALEELLIRSENMARLLVDEGYGLHDAQDPNPFVNAHLAINQAKPNQTERMK